MKKIKLGKLTIKPIDWNDPAVIKRFDEAKKNIEKINNRRKISLFRMNNTYTNK